MVSKHPIADPAAYVAARIEPDLNTGCWLWTGSMMGDGYGYLRPYGGTRNVRAHRFALMLSGVDVPANAVVMHRCDTPACVNPAHLTVGTHSENIADKVQKGRQGRNTGRRWTKRPESIARGEKHGRWIDGRRARS